MSNTLQRSLITISLLSWAVAAAAQTPVLDPRYAEFNASADHNATTSTGQAMVTRYDLEFYFIGAQAPFQTNSLGKPTPNTSGVIRVDLNTILTAFPPPGTTYEARVTAVGPTGMGRSDVSNQFAFSDPCASTITPTGTSVGAASSTGSVAVAVAAGCNWSASSNAAWVTITGGSTGSGPGTVNYSIAANTTTTPRTGSLTIAGHTFTITQAAGCTFSISPTSLSITAGARTGSVSVTAAAGCAWTASSTVGWITLTGGTNGSGNGTVSYSIAANTSITPRTGVVTIAGQSFTVTQAGVPCTASLSPTGVSVTAGATTGSFGVSIPAGCAWTASDNASWVSITSGGTGTGNGTVAYSINANPNTTERTAAITVAGETFTITQAGVVCAISISPTASSPTHAGGTGTLTVTANASSCSWSAASDSAWISLTGATSGNGSGSVPYTVAPNTSTSSRTGHVTVAGQTLTITQSPAPCTFSIVPTQASIAAQASTNTIGVTAPAGCSWTASESSTWISITSGASGSGNGTITYSVTANSSITPRTATITAAGQSFTVTQAGQTCDYTLSPTSASVAGTSSTGSVAVGALAGCPWTATSGVSWATITSGASGSGGGTVNYSIAANLTSSIRTGALTIAGQTFTISQAAGCSFAISPTSLSVASGARTGSVSVSAGAGCSWTAVSSASWITITSGSSGSGNGTVGYSIAANPSITPRTGVVTIAGATFTVTQAGVPCTATLSPTGVSVEAGATTGSISVSIPAGCAWTASDNASWVSITSGASGSGNGTVTFSIAANPTTAQRTAAITVAGQTFGITQAGIVCSITVSPTALSPTHAGGSGTVTVTANASSCNWTAASNTPWITMTGGSSGTGSGTVSYTVAPNTTTSPRTGTMTIAGQTVTVTQAAAPCTFTIAPTQASISAEASSSTIAVTAPAGCSWTASESSTWISITSGASGSGNGTITYSVTENPGITPRTATITAAGQSFTVTQAGQTCTYSLTPTSTTAGATGTTGSVSLFTPVGCPWTAASSVSWVTVTSAPSGTGTTVVSYAVAANDTASPRSGTLTIGGVPFTVTQAGGTCTYSTSPTSDSFGAAGGTDTIRVSALNGCQWTATSNAAWITITDGGTGSGNGTIDYEVAPNSEPTPRSAAIAVGGRAVTISQSAAPCTYTLSPSSVSLDADAATGSFSIDTANGCAWTASSSATWLSITGATSGNGDATIAYSAGANTTAALRTATITVGGRTFTVTQAAPVCSFTLSTTSLSVLSPASTGTVLVTAGSGCAWTAASSASWITITGGSTGSGNGTVSLAITANTSSASRTGSVTIAGQTVTVTQQGAPCTTSISPASASVSMNATAGTVGVSTPAGCSWTAASNVTWITITSGSSGSGAGSVAYSVAANAGTTSRVGTLTIGGQTFQVTQAGQTCIYTLSPTSVSVSGGGSTGSANVSALTGCPWTATSNVSWVSITGGASGSGSGAVNYSIAANPTTTPRTGTMTIAGQTFTISQGGAPCSYTVSPMSDSYGAGGGSGTLNLTSDTACSWSATASVPWITISGGTGSGNGTIGYQVAVNPDAAPRSGTIVVGGRIVTISQAAATCTFTLSPSSVSITAAAATGSFSVAGATGCTWTASSSAGWLTLSGPTSGNGNGTVGYSAAANTSGSARTATVTVGGRTFTVQQAAPVCTFTLSTTSVSVQSPATTSMVSVTAGTACNWTASSSTPWIDITNAGPGSGSGMVTISIEANTSSTPRTGSITIAGQTVTVTQLGRPCSIAMSPAGASASADATTGSIAVTTASGCSWQATSNAAWITINSGGNYSGSSTVSYTLAANSGGSVRFGTMTIGGQTFMVSQAGRQCTFSVDPASVSIGAAGIVDTIAVTASAGCSWTATSSAPSWITVDSPAGGTGTGTVTFRVAPNSSTAVRSGTITVAGRLVWISQAGTCAYSLSPFSVSLSSGTGTTTVYVFTGSGCSWTAVSDTPWITVASGQNGTGGGVVSLSVAVNTGTTSRSGTATIAGQTFTVNQSACSYSLSPAAVSLGSGNVSSNAFITTGAGCTWSATKDASWITFPGASSGSGTSWLTYTLATNTSNSPRTGTITVAGRTLAVTQAAAPCSYTVTPTSLTVPNTGGTTSVTVQTGSACSWSTTNSTPWITVTSGQTGSGSATVVLQVAPNPSTFPRTTSLYVAGRLVFVNQHVVTLPNPPSNLRITIP